MMKGATFFAFLGLLGESLAWNGGFPQCPTVSRHMSRVLEHHTSSTKAYPSRARAASALHMSTSTSVEEAAEMMKWLSKNGAKDIAVEVGPSKNPAMGYGLIATKELKRGSPALLVPFDLCLTPTSCMKTPLGALLKAASFDGWTGDVGLIALQILWEKSQADKSKLAPFIKTLPGPGDSRVADLLVMWTEQELEIAQQSSTRGLKGFVDDVVEDFGNLQENVIGPNQAKLSPEVFTLENFKWAVGVAASRSFFVDGELRLVPLLDYANHQPGKDYREPVSTGLGVMGGKGVRAEAAKEFAKGDEFFVSYGPKTPAEYLEEHGFVPDDPSVEGAQLCFELIEEDKFFDDKADILEQAGVDFKNCFDVTEKGTPDEFMLQFLRLKELSGADCFLLEAVFRTQIWYDFMSLPVSEDNEQAVNSKVMAACKEAMASFTGSEADDKQIASGGTEASVREIQAAKVRLGERRALQGTLEWFQKDSEALDLKEYYQERRLKELGLDQPLDEAELAPGNRGRDLDW